jgi:hypothetical protein
LSREFLFFYQEKNNGIILGFTLLFFAQKREKGYNENNYKVKIYKAKKYAGKNKTKLA